MGGRWIRKEIDCPCRKLCTIYLLVPSHTCTCLQAGCGHQQSCQPGGGGGQGAKVGDAGGDEGQGTQVFGW